MRRGHQASTTSTREDPSSQEREGGERIEWVGVDVSEERVSVRVVANGLGGWRLVSFTDPLA